MFRKLALLLLLAGGLVATPRASHADRPMPAPVAAAPARAPLAVKRAAVRPPGTAARSVYKFISSRYGERKARAYAPLVLAKAMKYNLPPLLVAKVIHRESSFRPHVELRGCYGLMQVAHFHFRRGENPRDPATNIDAGCRLLAGFHKRFGNWPQALTAYNFGPNATVSRGLGSSRYARQVLAGR